MSNSINFKHIATEVGDRLKYDKTLNEIDRLGQSLLKINKDVFPNSAITSSRAKSIYDWILSLGQSSVSVDEKVKRLVAFCLEMTTEDQKPAIIELLRKNNCPYNLIYKDSNNEFLARNFHAQIVRNSQKLFLQANYFHSVFEAVKAYNKHVKEKALSDKDGQALMLGVWGWDSGVLKVTRCENQTEKDFQDGLKFLSGGLMAAIRNPTAHEPQTDWPITKQDCLDILSVISFLYRQLDASVYVPKT